MNVDKLKQECSALEAKIAKQNEETNLAERKNELLKQRIAELEKLAGEDSEGKKAADGADGNPSPSPTPEEGKDGDRAAKGISVYHRCQVPQRGMSMLRGLDWGESSRGDLGSQDSEA